MENLERLAGRLAHDFSQLDSDSPEELLRAAPLVSQLTEELEGELRVSDPGPSRLVASATSSSRRALVVDDSPEDRRQVLEMLERLGYTVIVAASGSEALALCASDSGPFDVMLAGVLLEDMSGCEAAERAALLKPEMGVIYMSGYAGDEVMSCGILGPGVAKLEKPVTFEALERRLAELRAGQLV